MEVVDHNNQSVIYESVEKVKYINFSLNKRQVDTEHSTCLFIYAVKVNSRMRSINV